MSFFDIFGKLFGALSYMDHEKQSNAIRVQKERSKHNNCWTFQKNMLLVNVRKQPKQCTGKCQSGTPLVNHNGCV